MVISTPALHRHFPHQVKVLSTPQISNLKTYLEDAIDNLQNFDPNLYPHYALTIARLRQTLTQIEVAHIRHTAIASGVWDFYPTNHEVIEKMLNIAQIQPHHRILEPQS